MRPQTTLWIAFGFMNQQGPTWQTYLVRVATARPEQGKFEQDILTNCTFH